MVVNQPVVPPAVRATVTHPAHDYLVFTIIMMIICGAIANIPAFVCLVPALLFASKVCEWPNRLNV